ncbi:Outer membrane porin protein 32 [Tepidimonas alkaliphilus]|uniref:Outer membrane porin protein 32 n=1 Tax=Tepidimonas alkaliphilus TaxID=2588942 RepID=A0A554W7W0_9BURK|nr:porin [Tepidimonas alkaliphilus]TSE19659.1 Outer membrane porin protein 32 [Tepidimonas alkaliphilus]
MKKSIWAVAALLTAGSAWAQSSVTFYGRIDLSVGSIKDNGTGATSNKLVNNTRGQSVTRMFQGGDGGLTTSRWGLRGTEDLGGGLKAAFKLENRFDADTGASQDPFFKGESSLSLIGGFGEIKLGRSTSVYDDVRAVGQKFDVFDSAFTASSNGVFKSGGDYANRLDNKISYYSPDFGGFYAGLDYSFDEDKTKSADRYALKFGYKEKAFEIALGYQNEKDKGDKYTVLAGNYNFGSFALSASYNHRNGAAANGDDNEYAIGVAIPVDAWTFSAGYASSKTKNSTGGTKNAKAQGFALGVTYALSKRTRLYAGYRDVEVKNNVGVKTKDERLYAVGVRHDF